MLLYEVRKYQSQHNYLVGNIGLQHKLEGFARRYWSALLFALLLSCVRLLKMQSKKVFSRGARMVELARKKNQETASCVSARNGTSEVNI